jgi:hypothetical protein
MMLSPGETARYSCDQCSTEFEVTLEPKAKGDNKEQAKIESQTVDFCPFCGEEDVSCDSI